MRSRLSTVPGGPATVLVVGLLVLAIAGLVVLDAARADRVAQGVSVEGTDIGGLTADEATEVVREEFAEPIRRTIVASRGDREFELPPGESQLAVDVEGTVDAAVERSREGIPGLRAVGDVLGWREVDVDLEPTVHYSEQAVESFVEEVAEELDRPPRDAQIEPAAEGLETTSERPGFDVNRQELRDRVERALESPDEHAIQVPWERTAPQTTLDDLAEQNPHYIIIDREGFQLRYYEELELEEVYPISVGDIGHRTPAGEYDISNKAVNPTWFVPDADWAGDLAGETIPPGPDNPIKSRWLGVEDGIGIHGTDEADSIGERASRGCIRMLIPDVEELYDQVPIGTPVYID